MAEGGRSFLRRPWSWFIGGIFFGIAQLIYAAWFVSHKNLYHYLTVTTQLAGMFGTLERVFNLRVITREITLSNGDTVIPLKPDIHWFVWALILFSFLIAAYLERDYRGWVRYNWKYILLAFFGGMVFSYGTRLAAGCTLNHMFGGFSVMTIASMFVLLGILIGALPTFYLVSKYFGPYIKPWEYKGSYPEYLEMAKKFDLKGDYLVHDPRYRWYKNPLHILLLLGIIGMAIITLYYGIIGQIDGITLKHGLQAKDMWYVVASVLAAIFVAFGVVKAGLGSVCGEICPEASLIIDKQSKQLADMKLPTFTMVTFRSMQPFIGVLTIMLITGFGGFVAWANGATLYHKTGLYLPHLGHIIGGILLGAGAVMILGCEFRTYVRVGVGFLNSLAAFIGFYFGYWPFALLYEQHLKFFESTRFFDKYFLFQLIDGSQELGYTPLRGIAYIAWLLLLLGLLIFAVYRGAKNLDVSPKDILLKSPVELYVELVKRNVSKVMRFVEEASEKREIAIPA